MPALSNQRHELFAQALAKGKPQVEAYVEAGYKQNRSAATRLAADVNIRGRVSELGAKVAARTEITAASITERLMRLATIAEETGVTKDDDGTVTASSSKHLGVLRAALMDVAKLNGLVIDKGENTNSGALTVTYVNAPKGAAPPPSEEDYETGA